MPTPRTVTPNDFPELRLITWNRDGSRPIPADEVFHLYEANWRHVDQQRLTALERELIDDLTVTYGSGHLLVPG